MRDGLNFLALRYSFASPNWTDLAQCSGYPFAFSQAALGWYVPLLQLRLVSIRNFIYCWRKLEDRRGKKPLIFRRSYRSAEITRFFSESLKTIRPLSDSLTSKHIVHPSIIYRLYLDSTHESFGFFSPRSTYCESLVAPQACITT